MGGLDKPLLPLGDATVIDHVIERIRPQVSALAINANGDPGRFAHLGLPVLRDMDDERPGPLAGVLAGLDWASSLGASAVVTVAGDTPFFPRDLVQRLAASVSDDTPIALAATQAGGERVMRHPTFGLWPVSLRDDLAIALSGGVRKIVAWTDTHGAAAVVFDSASYDPFFNLNAPEDRDAAEALLRQMAA